MNPLVLMCLAGCLSGTLQQDLPLDADYGLFVQDVQPLLMGRCGNSDCHGSSARVLEVYTPTHRQEGASGALTDDEIWANYLRASVFLQGLAEPTDSWLLRKPLGPAAGGLPHVGEVQFETADAGGYVVIEDWIRSTQRWGAL